MKTTTPILLGVALLLAVSVPGFSQRSYQLHEIYEMMEDPSANFYDVQAAANAYFEGTSKGRGTGYKQFKRWEAEMQYWIDEQGNRLDPRKIYEENEKFRKENAIAKGQQTMASTWIEMGPDYWNKTSSWAPGLGRIDAVEVDPGNLNHILIGSPEGGVWKTTDGGATWKSLTDGLAYMKIGDVAIDPTNPNTYYIGTLGAGMLKSTDGGVTLTQINSGFTTSSTVKKIIVDPTNSNNVLMATSGGVYRSTNGGSSWTKSSSTSVYDIEFKPGDPTVVYSCGTGFYRSTNSGATFTAVTGFQYSSAMRLAVTAANPSVVYVVQCNGSVFGAVYKSTNSGQSFTTQVTGNSANGTNYFGYSPNGTDNSGQGSYNIDITVSPTDENEVHIGGIITWKSTNGGTSFVATTEWTYPNNRGYTHCDMHALEYVNGTLFTGSDGGIFKSTDKGDNFTNISFGMGIRMFYRLGLADSDPAKVVCGAQDNGACIRTSTGNWIDWLGADGMEQAFDRTNANIVYGSSQNGELYKSTNGGTSYSDIPEPETSGDWTTPFELDHNAANTIYAAYTEVHKSTNGGSSWTQISNIGSTSVFKHMTVAPSNSNYIYAARGTAIYRTADGGATWANISSGLNSYTINRISVHDSDPKKVAVALSSSKVYVSNDAGATWTNYTANLPAVSARCLVYENGSKEGIYVGTNTGVYYRDNTMTSWVPYSTGLPQVPVNELEIQYTAGKVRIATYGRGVWEVDQYGSTTGISDQPSSIFGISAFPNPTTGPVQVSVPGLAAGEYQLNVVNALGQIIYSEGVTADQLKHHWIDLGANAQGIYTIRIKGMEQEGSVRILVDE